MVQRDRDRSDDDHEWIRKDRQEGDKNEEVEVHLDLHRSLTEMHQQPAQAHRGEPEHQREVAHVLELEVRQCGTDQQRAGGDACEHGPGAADRSDEHHHGNVRIEEQDRDAVESPEVILLKLGHGARKHEIRKE